MLIDNTYFQGSGLFNVPNIDRENPVEEGNYNQLTAFINVYEPEICRRVIGKTLYDALITDEIAAAGLDVLCQEPMSEQNPLFQIKDSRKLLITPHIAWAGIEARMRLMDIILNQIKDFFEL